MIYNRDVNKPFITSLSNPLIKQARTLHQKKARAESGLFLVEGLHHVGEAIEANWDIESILYASDILTSDFGRQLTSRASLQSKLQAVSVQVIESLADKENPQGILAIVHQKQTRFADLKKINSGAAVEYDQIPSFTSGMTRSAGASGAVRVIFSA